MLHTSLTRLATVSGTRSLAARRTFLRLHRELCLAVQPIDPLVVHAWNLRAQQVVDAAIAEAPPHLCDFDDLDAELLRGLIDHRRVAIAVPGEPLQAARTTFGQVMLLDHLGRRCAPDLRG